jgi:hypothetical protein
MILLKRDVTDPKETWVLLFKAWHPNANGTVSLEMPDGTFAYQTPNQYGVFGFAATPDGAYQYAKVNGQLVAFWTRPQDQPMVYSWVELPN